MQIELKIQINVNNMLIEPVKKEILRKRKRKRKTKDKTLTFKFISDMKELQ